MSKPSITSSINLMNLDQTFSSFALAEITHNNVEFSKPLPFWLKDSYLAEYEIVDAPEQLFELSPVFQFILSDCRLALEQKQPEESGDSLGESKLPVIAYRFISDSTYDSGSLIIQDQTQTYHKTQELLQTARENLLVHEQLQQEISQKEFLLNAVVHDLASPLTAIQGALSMIQFGLDDQDPNHQLITLALKQCEKQQRMLRSVLDTFTLPEGGKLALAQPDQPCDPVPLLTQLTQAYQSGFQLKKITLKLEIKEPFNSHLWIDGTVLERVIGNILDNAYRHLETGNTLTIQLSEQEEYVAIDIIDDGPGIPKHHHKSLFSKYKDFKTHGKAGLGLFFCSKALEAVGGSISLEGDETTQGAHFHLRFPKESS